MLIKRLATAPDALVETRDGTVVFFDISGFTRLSERLARRGKEGAEQLTETINSCFSTVLADAYDQGGSLLKFGGDALLLWFEGPEHATRACSAAVGMRTTLRRVGRVRAGSTEIVLRMSAGVHSGAFELFLVGSSHRELVIAGPASSSVVEMEAAASAGQILLSPQTAAILPRGVLGAATGPGVLLARAPSVGPAAGREEVPRPEESMIANCLSTAIRAHVLRGPAAPEHRTAVISFVEFGGVNELVESRGAAAAADALDTVVATAQDAADLFQVCFLGSDVTAGGGKLILTAGAPRAVGDDEERMLLAVRHIVEQPRELPVRVGVNRGQVFAGEIGPHYRRTYSVMGDAVNLGARLMAKAPWGSVYATEGVLDRSQTKFEVTRLEPFMVKGKRRPVEAWAIGPLARPTVAQGAKRAPLVGRDAEYAALREALHEAERGHGRLVEIVGEAGSGKSRLLTEARELAGGFGVAHTICENYRRSVPYVVWRDILRQLLGLHWEDPDGVVIAAVRARIEVSQHELLPWLPLLGIVLDVDVPMTREVSELAADYRTAKLHEVVLEFLEPLLAIPTLVQIEHAHFMDEASAALLHAIARRLDSSAWVATVTRRDATDGFVGNPGSSTQLVLGPLPADAMMELAESAREARIVPPHVLEMAIDRAGGSPEFLLDLLAAAAGGSGALPDSLDAATSARIDELDPRDRVLVRRASVLGLCFHLRLLPHVLGAGAPEPDAETWRRVSSIFADDGDGYIRFKRPALCEVAYEGLPFRVRRELHSAVGRALEAQFGRDADADPAVLSLHFIRAGDHARAWRYARLGAERATARYAHADAAELHRRAIEAGRQDGATVKDLAASFEALGDALALSGQLREASDALSGARRLLAGDRLAQARLLLRHATIARRGGNLSSAVRWALRGLRALDGVPDDEGRAVRAGLLAKLGYTRHHQGRLREAERLCRQAISEAEAVDEELALAYASYVLDLVLFESGRHDEVVHSRRALEIYERLGDLQQQGSVLNNLAFFAYFRWKWDEALELYRRSEDCRVRAGDPAEIAQCESNIAEILCDRGAYEEAEAHQRRAQRVWSSTGERAHAAYATALLGRLAVRTARYDEGLSLLREASEELHKLREQAYAEFAESLVAEGEAFGGDPTRAVEIADQLLSASSRPQPLLHRVRGIGLARLGQRAAALRELERSVAIASEHGVEYELACGLDILELLGPSDSRRARQRDAILARLKIAELPRPRLTPVRRGRRPVRRPVAA